MKIEKEAVVIPEKIIEQEVYVCETCGAKHDTSNTFRKCEVCGKEICRDCQNKQYLFETPLLNFFPRSNTLQLKKRVSQLIGSDDYGDVEMNDPHHLCEDCASNLYIDSYKNNITVLVDQFNNSLKDLNEIYIKGNLSR